MAKKPQPNSVSLEKLANDRLPSVLRDAVENVELEARSLPRLLMMTHQGYFILSINARIPIKRLLVMLGAIGSVTWAAVKIVTMNWDTVQLLFPK